MWNFRISELTDSFDFFKNRDVEPDQLFALPDAAVYNEPRDLRQNIYSDTWLETYDTVLDWGPYNEGLKLSWRFLSLRNFHLRIIMISNLIASQAIREIEIFEKLFT